MPKVRKNAFAGTLADISVQNAKDREKFQLAERELREKRRKLREHRSLARRKRKEVWQVFEHAGADLWKDVLSEVKKSEASADLVLKILRGLDVDTHSRAILEFLGSLSGQEIPSSFWKEAGKEAREAAGKEEEDDAAEEASGEGSASDEAREAGVEVGVLQAEGEGVTKKRLGVFGSRKTA